MIWTKSLFKASHITTLQRQKLLGFVNDFYQVKTSYKISPKNYIFINQTEKSCIVPSISNLEFVVLHHVLLNKIGLPQTNVEL